MKLLRLAGLILSLVSLISIGSCASSYRTNTITGYLRLVGNEPHTSVILEPEAMPSEGGRYLLIGDLVGGLKQYQSQKITIRGEIGKVLPGNTQELYVMEILDRPEARPLPATKPRKNP